jgi:hypothetical protein
MVWYDGSKCQRCEQRLALKGASLMENKMTPRQLLVECSDPGLVISLAEEFEHVLRHVDFERACALRDQLRDLACELGTEFERAWGGFRLEVPHDGDRPLAFGSRDAVAADEKLVQQTSHLTVLEFGHR